MYIRNYLGLKRIALVNMSLWDLNMIYADPLLSQDRDLLTIDLHLDPLHNPLYAAYMNTKKYNSYNSKSKDKFPRDLRIVLRILPTFTDVEFDVIGREVIEKSLQKFNPDITLIVAQGYILMTRPLISQPFISPNKIAEVLSRISRITDSKVVVLGQCIMWGPLSILLLVYALKELLNISGIDDVLKATLDYMSRDSELRKWISIVESSSVIFRTCSKFVDESSHEYIIREIEKIKRYSELLR